MSDSLMEREALVCLAPHVEHVLQIMLENGREAGRENSASRSSYLPFFLYKKNKRYPQEKSMLDVF